MALAFSYSCSHMGGVSPRGFLRLLFFAEKDGLSCPESKIGNGEKRSRQNGVCRDDSVESQDRESERERTINAGVGQECLLALFNFVFTCSLPFFALCLWFVLVLFLFFFFPSILFLLHC